MSRAIRRSAVALTLVTAACLPAVVAAPVSQATSAPTTAYAVIGSITASWPLDMLALDSDDDTLYAGSYSGSYVTAIPPGTTSGVAQTTLSLPARPASLAVDSDDDTVYVRPNLGSYVWVTRGARTLDDTIGVDFGLGQYSGLASIAVDSDDDTLYASALKYQYDDSFIAIDGANTDDSVQSRGVGAGTYSMAVDQQQGTIWIAGLDSNTVKTASGSALTFSGVPGTYTSPRDLALSSTTHQAFVSTTVNGAPAVKKMDATGTLATWSDPAADGTLSSLSVNPAGTRVAFSTGSNDDSLWIVDATTMQSEAAPIQVYFMSDTAQASSGLIYVGQYMGTQVTAVAKVSGSLSAASANPGDTLTVTVAPTPAVAAGQPVVVDANTVTAVDFGGVTASVTPTGTNAFSVIVPQAVNGSVEAVATLAGGATISLGNVTVGGTPAPPPAPIPASAPTSVTAEAGDTAAVVSWSPPASTGSYPVATYQVTSTPGGHTCLTESLTCTVTGLTSGTAYSFTVRALTGAGWSVASEPSRPVVTGPDAGPSITITGSRDGSRIEVTGTTVGFSMGGTLRPWLRTPGQSTYAQGAATILVSTDGTFEWGRRTGKKVSVYVATPDGSVRSNSVEIAAP